VGIGLGSAGVDCLISTAYGEQCALSRKDGADAAIPFDPHRCGVTDPIAQFPASMVATDTEDRITGINVAIAGGPNKFLSGRMALKTTGVLALKLVVGTGYFPDDLSPNRPNMSLWQLTCLHRRVR
jgi:hypothetical protein